MRGSLAEQMPASDVIGRERELGDVEAFLTAASARPAALVLSGPPGIGKTSVWEAGVARAGRRGARVLAHRSVETETGFGFAGLADLVGPVLPEVADELPGPRRRALEVALLLADPPGPPPEPHGIVLALVDVLGVLGRKAPVILALDDLQWLDASSAAAIPAALRRLTSEPVGVLATTRGDDAPLLAGVLEEGRLRSLPLAPLRPAATHRMLRERLRVELSRPQTTRIHEISGGNPFFALELGRAVASAPPGEPIRVPRSLGELLGGRLDDLSGEIDVLLSVAALARPTIDALMAVHGEERAFAALQAAVAAGVVDVDDERVRFTHPLIASLCYERAPVWQRRRVHRALAATSIDVEERARHLALSADEADAVVAEELDRAAVHATSRGAVAAATQLAELAAVRTPPRDADARHRRRLAAAHLHWLAGDIARVKRLYDELLADLPPGAQRADVLHATAVSG